MRQRLVVACTFISIVTIVALLIRSQFEVGQLRKEIKELRGDSDSSEDWKEINTIHVFIVVIVFLALLILIGGIVYKKMLDSKGKVIKQKDAEILNLKNMKLANKR